MWWRCTTATLLGVSFGSYRRRPRYILMGRSGYVLLKCLGDVPLRRHWVFHLRLAWDVVETYCGTSLLRPHEMSSRHTNKTSWSRTTETSLRRSTETSLGVSIWDVPATPLGRTERRHYDVATTSCCRVGFKSKNIARNYLRHLYDSFFPLFNASYNK